MMEKTTHASGLDRLPCVAGAFTDNVAAPRADVSVNALISATLKAPTKAKMAGKTTFKMAGSGEAVIEIDGYIGGEIDWWTWEESGKSAATLRSEIKKAGNVSTIRVLLNSTGGLALQGSQMFNVLRAAANDGIEIIIEVGAACMSAATLVSCAGMKVRTAKNSVWMFHDPASYVEGNATELRAQADALDTLRDAVVTIYDDFNKSMDAEAIKAMMSKTTYYTGEEALAAGWATELLDAPAPDIVMALDFDALDLTNASDEVKARIAVMREATMSAAKEAETEPKPELTPADVDANADTLQAQIEDLTAQIDVLTATNAELVKRVEAAPKPEQKPEPEMKGPVVDLKSPAVAALMSIAKMDGRDKEFTLAVNAGATLAQLRQRFIEALPAKTEDISGAGLVSDPVIQNPSADFGPDPDDIYAEMNGKKKAK